MSAKDAYRKQMEVEVEVAQVKLKMLKNFTSSLTIADNLDYPRMIASAELKVFEMRARLKEFDRVQENTWQQMQGRVDQVWSILQLTLHDITTGLMANSRSAKDPERSTGMRQET